MTRKVIMALSVLIAGLSGLAFFGEGLQMWFWQFFSIFWIVSCYRKDKKIEKFSKLLKK
jgi:hypothetical protein